MVGIADITMVGIIIMGTNIRRRAIDRAAEERNKVNRAG